MRALHLRGILCGFALTIALLSFGAPASAHAQESQPSLVINQVDATRYPEVTSVVTVLDERGVPVPDLPPSAFAVSEAGQPLGAPAVESSVGADVPLAQLAEAWPGQSFIVNFTGLDAFRLAAGDDPLAAGRLYLVDPRGYLMMSYAADADPQNIISDLKRLVRYSRG